MIAVKLAMNTGTLHYVSLDLPSACQAISKAGFKGINLRDNHVEEYIKKGHSLQELKTLMKEYELRPIAIDALRNWQIWGDDELSSQSSKEEYRKCVEQYMNTFKELDCDYVMCTAPHEPRDISRDIKGFRALCDIAKSYDARVAMEFLPYAGLRDIRTAWEVVQKADCPNGGLLVDTFHFFKGGSKIEHLREVPTEKIFFVHCNDAPDLAMDVRLLAKKRVFPGEGVLPLREFFDILVSEKGFSGWIVLEVLNSENEHLDYLEVAEKGKKTMTHLLGGLGQ